MFSDIPKFGHVVETRQLLSLSKVLDGLGNPMHGS